MAPNRWWANGDPIATAFYNALSATFPRGEAYFVESVRAFRDGTPPKLAAEINAFIKQEVMHSREHIAFNGRAVEAGYDLSLLDADVTKALALAKGRPPIVSLAATMALEHFTAILAHELLADPRHLDGAVPEAAALWRWHAMEEVEHKGVAFDTWNHATRHLSKFKRWSIRSRVMLAVTQRFVHHRTRGVLELLRQDGLTGPHIWLRVAHYALIRPGMFRKILGAWASYFRPNFHPWEVDDRELIRRAESEYANALMDRQAA